MAATTNWDAGVIMEPTMGIIGSNGAKDQYPIKMKIMKRILIMVLIACLTCSEVVPGINSARFSGLKPTRRRVLLTNLMKKKHSIAKITI
jgi:hypothetical protein